MFEAIMMTCKLTVYVT